MGLDASVRCRCFEERKLNPGPVPYEDLYIDSEGYLSSKKLDEARLRFDYRQYDARYGDLSDAFRKWLGEEACEHPYGDYHSDRIANWSGVHQFEDFIETCGGKEAFPLLSTMLPDGNGGFFPAELAGPALAEMDRLFELEFDEDGKKPWDRQVDEIVWKPSEGNVGAWVKSPIQHDGTDSGKVFAANPLASYARTLPQDEGVGGFGGTSSGTSRKVPCDVVVRRAEHPSCKRVEYWIAERIRGLLQASLETGNPILWE